MAEESCDADNRWLSDAWMPAIKVTESSHLLSCYVAPLPEVNRPIHEVGRDVLVQRHVRYFSDLPQGIYFVESRNTAIG